VRIDNDGLSLNVTEDGDPAAPPLLLLHGITSFGGTWQWLVPELAERFRVLRLDFRGHGASERSPNGYTSLGYASDAIAACEQVAGAPCVVIGHSLGGITAAIVMQQRPDLVRAAVLEDPPLGLRGSEPTLELGEGHAIIDSFRLMRQSLPGIQAVGMTPDAMAVLLGTVPAADGSTMGTSIHPDGLLSMAGSLLTVDPTVLDPVLEGTIDMLLDPDIGFTTPTLIVTADPAKPDAVADPVAARRLAEQSSSTEVLTIAGAGHLIHDEIASRETFRAAVMEFLARVAS
jgi:esterase